MWQVALVIYFVIFTIFDKVVGTCKLYSQKLVLLYVLLFYCKYIYFHCCIISNCLIQLLIPLIDLLELNT